MRWKAMKNKCPICERPKLEECEETALCTECVSQRFYDDDDREVEYRATVKERIEELRKLFKEDYNDTLHTDMVEQIVRCEIAIHRYEQLIANNLESDKIAEYLKSERAHWNKLAEKLHMTIKSFRGDTKNIKHDFSNDFKTYLAQMMDAANDEEEAKEPEE
jgi:hypothetical protein